MSRESPIQPDAMRADPDADLVRGLKCGSAASFRLLLRRYQHPVYAYVCRLINDSVEAEDVTQDVFIKVFRKVQTFREDCSFKTWLYRIAVRESSNRRRWFSRHRFREVVEYIGNSQPNAHLDALPDPRRSPFDQTERREQRDLLNDALSKLDPKYQEAVVLRDVVGLSYQEIAEALGIALGTVKSRIVRGREGLKRHLLAHAPTLAPERATWQTE